MKKIQSIFIIPFLLTVFISSCKKQAIEPDYVDKGYFYVNGNADFAQMVPAPTVTSTGTAVFTSRFDNNSKVFNYTLEWSKLSSIVTKADLVFPSNLTQNGLLVRNIFTGQTYGNTGTVPGYIWGINALSEDEQAALKAGKVYYVIYTQSNTSGEIRGQLTLVK